MNHVYKCAAALAGLVFTAGAASAAPAYTATDLNLRSGPSTGYAVVATMPYGSEVEIVECYGDGWCQIDWSGYSGYASEEYLDAAGYAPSYVPPVADYSAGRYYYNPGYDYRPPVVRNRVVVRKPVIVHKRVVVKKPVVHKRVVVRKPAARKRVVVKQHAAGKRTVVKKNRPQNHKKVVHVKRGNGKPAKAKNDRKREAKSGKHNRGKRG